MRRISDIIQILLRAKARGAKLVGKTPLERELNDWINTPIRVLSFDWVGAPACPAPIRYEDQYLASPEQDRRTFNAQCAPRQASVASALA